MIWRPLALLAIELVIRAALRARPKTQEQRLARARALEAQADISEREGDSVAAWHLRWRASGWRDR
jgi:Arc/MetJ-type ribon-helix-helix transcriptional regulator